LKINPFDIPLQLFPLLVRIDVSRWVERKDFAFAGVVLLLLVYRDGSVVGEEEEVFARIE
jgi:hypothetical protein